MQDFFNRVLRDISGTGDNTGAAFKILANLVQHGLHEINSSISGCFGADGAATELHTFAGQNANKAIGNSFELAEHIADFSATHANIARRYIGIFTNVTVQLVHERLAEPHNLKLAFALWIEVGTAFCPAHGQAG